MKRILKTIIYAGILSLCGACSKESSLADAPSAIVGISENGGFRVSQYLFNGNLVRTEYEGFLAGIGSLNRETSEKLKHYLNNRVELTYVIAIRDSRGFLEIEYLDEKSNTCQSLNNLVEIWLREKGAD